MKSHKMQKMLQQTSQEQTQGQCLRGDDVDRQLKY